MKTLEFAHPYTKIPSGLREPGEIAGFRLLAVTKVERNGLSDEFIDYDSRYESDGELRHYDIKPDDTFLLLIIGPATNGRGPIWTTLRQDNAETRLKWRPEVGHRILIRGIGEEGGR